MESKQGRREEEVRPSRETRPEGFARRSQLVREEGVDRRGNAKLSRRETKRGGKTYWDAKQRDRYLPRSTRSRIASEPLGPREARVCTLRPGEDRVRGRRRSGGRQQAYVEALVPHELDTGMPMFSTGPISRSRSGAGPTRSGCNSTLTWRGFEVLLPSHWHCSRFGQGRQLRMLAPYTMRRLPSASLRCSCGVSF